MSIETKIQAILTLIVVGVAIVHMVISVREERKRKSSRELVITLRAPADVHELGKGLVILLNALSWYSDGDNHPSARVARQAIEEFCVTMQRGIKRKEGRA